MTRGYFLVVKKQQIINGVYLSSDAYPNYYGVKILEAVMDGQTGTFIENARKELEGSLDDIDLTKYDLGEFIHTRKKGKEDDGPVQYPEYTYILDDTSKTLKVYNFGDSIYQVKPENYERALYAFEHEFDLVSALSIDETSCIRMIDGRLELNKLIKSGVSTDFLYGIVACAPAVSIEPKKEIYKRSTGYSHSQFEHYCSTTVWTPAIDDQGNLDWDDLEETYAMEAIFRPEPIRPYELEPRYFYAELRFSNSLAMAVRGRTLASLTQAYKDVALFIKKYQSELQNIMLGCKLKDKAVSAMKACAQKRYPLDETDAAVLFAQRAMEHIKAFPTPTAPDVESAYSRLVSEISDAVLTCYGETGRHEEGR